MGDVSFWQRIKQLGRGDIRPIVQNFERQMARAEEHTADAPEAIRKDVSLIAGIALTMLAIKMVKILPSLPFAPGHKMVLLTPLYIVAAALTKSRFGATLTGLTMGVVAFLMGDGRYGIFEILKHIAPGLLCDLLVPLLMRKTKPPGPAAWTAVGGTVGLGRFTTVFCVLLAVQPPAVAYALLLPGLIANVVFGLMSGYVSYHLLRAVIPTEKEKDPTNE